MTNKKIKIEYREKPNFEKILSFIDSAMNTEKCNLIECLGVLELYKQKKIEACFNANKLNETAEKLS